MWSLILPHVVWFPVTEIACGDYGEKTVDTLVGAAVEGAAIIFEHKHRQAHSRAQSANRSFANMDHIDERSLFCTCSEPVCRCKNGLDLDRPSILMNGAEFSSAVKPSEVHVTVVSTGNGHYSLPSSSLLQEDNQSQIVECHTFATSCFTQFRVLFVRTFKSIIRDTVNGQVL